MFTILINTGLPQVRKWNWGKIPPGQGKVREFYFESGKNDFIFKVKSRKIELI